MNQYEVTFIVDPVLSGDEINATAQSYVDHLQSEGCKIVHVDEMGLKQLAYPLRKKTTGIYYCIEYQAKSGVIIDKLELAFRRDERIMRFLSVRLDKYGVKYNEDKRNGLIGKKSEAKKEALKEEIKEVKKEAAKQPAPAAAKAKNEEE
ncbi:MAG: 30S ribosomal protein S6 [Saprospiraceae bacterium]|nr:30S ribosomal protein S6 [Saprospiraceae bacterium]